MEVGGYVDHNRLVMHLPKFALPSGKYRMLVNPQNYLSQYFTFCQKVLKLVLVHTLSSIWCVRLTP